eukprot:1160668-Pelagomonas_calceolata.AAC.2
MPESEGVFRVDDNKDVNSKIIMLNMKKLAEVGTTKLEDLVERQWPSDVSAIWCGGEALFPNT